MFEQKTVKVIEKKDIYNIWEYTKEELHKIVGSFREEYIQAATGDVVHNEILGYVKEGIIEHALRFGAITRRGVRGANGKDIYYVRLPEYNIYREKLNAMAELSCRKEYAISKVGGENE